MLTSRFLSYRPKHGRAYMFLERGFDKIFGVYRPLLAFALRNRVKVIVIALASIAVGLFLFIKLDKEFMPAEDQGRYPLDRAALECSTSTRTSCFTP